MLERPSYNEIVKSIYNKIKSELGLDAPVDTSIIGAIVKVFSNELDNVWSTIESIHNSVDITTANGQALDGWGFLLGIQRREEMRATTLGLSRSIRFTNVGSNSYTIPQNTRVFREDNPQLAFFTSENLILNAGESGFVHASAASLGNDYNIPLNYVNKHSLPTSSIVVTNVTPIQNGSFRESDASYRERIIQAFQRRSVLNMRNLDALVRGVSGVKDVVIKEMSRGTGTVDIYVIPYSVSRTDQVLSDVTEVIEEERPVGVVYTVLGPEYRQLDLRITLRFDPSYNGNKEAIRQLIRDQISSKIDALPIDTGDNSITSVLYLQQIYSLAGTADPSIISVNMSVGLDGTPMNYLGEIKVDVGERIVLRSLLVQ